MSSFLSFLFTHSPLSPSRPAVLSGHLTRTKALVYACIGLCFLSLYLLLIALNSKTLVAMPAGGGTLRVGIIGAPRFINPLLAQTENERGIATLVFAGLMKEGTDGTPLPDLAESYEVSADNLKYTFTLRDHLSFHDKSPLTAADVLFTVEKMKSSVLNPSSAAYWQSITVSSPEERTIVFTLSSPDSSFLSRAAFGILPKAQWESVPDEGFADSTRTLRPIGAGAFEVSRLRFDKVTGSLDTIRLSRNKRAAHTPPLLAQLTITTSPNQQTLKKALEDGTIDMTADLTAETLALWQIPSILRATAVATGTAIALYHTANESLFSPALSGALNRYLIDKPSAPATIEDGYDTSSAQATADEQQAMAHEALLQALAAQGYRIDDGVLKKGAAALSIAIATVSSDSELVAAARDLSQELASVGIISEVQVFDPGMFQEKLEERSFPFVLISEGSTPLPSGYTKALSVHEKTQTILTHPFVGGVAPETLRSSRLLYASADTWHVYTDRLWKSLTIK